MPQSKFSGVSGCSDAAVSQGSISSTPTPSDIVIGKTTYEHNRRFFIRSDPVLKGLKCGASLCYCNQKLQSHMGLKHVPTLG